MDTEIIYKDCDFGDKAKYALVKFKNHGVFLIRELNGLKTRHEWYKDSKTQRPWIPKRKNWRSLVKQMIREGDFD